MPYRKEYVEPETLAEKDGVIILQTYADNDADAPRHYGVNVYYELGEHSNTYAVEEEGNIYHIDELPGYQAGWSLPVWTRSSSVCRWLQSLLETGVITKEWDTIEFPAEKNGE